MTRIELPPKWAPMPHDLITDQRVSDSAVRLYGLLYKCGWDRREIAGMADLVSLWPTPPDDRPPSERSVYRWLSQLESAGWATYHRKPGQRGLGDRLRLYPEPLTYVSADGKPLTPESEPLTPESEVPQTSDTRVRAPDTRVRAPDTRVRGLTDLAQQDAVKNGPQILDQIMVVSDLPPPDPVAPSAGGGGGGETQAILRAARVEADFADIPAAIARAAVATACEHPEAATKLPRLVAGLLKRYRAGRWTPPERSHDGRSSSGPDGSHRDELRAMLPDPGAGGRGGGLPGADGRVAGADHAEGLDDGELTAEQLAAVRRAATERFERLQRTRC